jgi:hypothetical protein
VLMLVIWLISRKAQGSDTLVCADGVGSVLHISIDHGQKSIMLHLNPFSNYYSSVLSSVNRFTYI